MADTTRESLNEAMSAAIDGEAEELELRRVLNAVERDPELMAKWQRMHLIGGVMRRETTRLGVVGRHGITDFEEPPEGLANVDVSPRRNVARWLGPVTGIAVAAAVMVAVALDTTQGVDAQGPTVAGLASAPNLAQTPSEEDLRRARDYLVRHAQHTSMTRTPTMPYVKALTVSSGGEESP